jgi:DNA-binding PadR family transcriptional regulator
MEINKIMEKNLKAFLDIVILAILSEESAHGYKIIATIHDEFGILLSPGSLYPLLHCLEEEKFVSSSINREKIVYRLTPKGKENFEKAFIAYNLSIQKMSQFVKTHVESASPLTRLAERTTHKRTNLPLNNGEL